MNSPRYCPHCDMPLWNYGPMTVCPTCKKELLRSPLTWLIVVAYVWTFDVWRVFA